MRTVLSDFRLIFLQTPQYLLRRFAYSCAVPLTLHSFPPLESVPQQNILLQKMQQSHIKIWGHSSLDIKSFVLDKHFDYRDKPWSDILVDSFHPLEVNLRNASLTL